MYVNQLIISFVVFGTLLYLMNTDNDNNKNKNKEDFYALNQKSVVPYYSNYTNNANRTVCGTLNAMPYGLPTGTPNGLPNNTQYGIPYGELDRALYYHPSYPYFTAASKPVQPLTTTHNNYKSFNDLNRQLNQFKQFNIVRENFNNNSNNDITPMGMMNPTINENKPKAQNKKMVKITFLLMLGGLIYYIYQNKSSE